MTMIARVADGLPLAASVQEDEQVCLQPKSAFYGFCPLSMFTFETTTFYLLLKLELN